MVLWLNIVLVPRMIWENQREPLAKFSKEPEASNLPQNTVLFLSRIPTKHNSGMWSYSDENAVIYSRHCMGKPWGVHYHCTLQHCKSAGKNCPTEL